jgi:hypothetical protein
MVYIFRLGSFYFKHKYNNVADGYSYHAILLNDNNEVVGGCSVLPMLYNRNDDIVKRSMLIQF